MLDGNKKTIQKKVRESMIGVHKENKKNQKFIGNVQMAGFTMVSVTVISGRLR